MKSKLLFESFSNGSKSVNLVSHSLLAYDTRYTGLSKSFPGYGQARHNAFHCILQPSKTGTNRASLQLELHYRYNFIIILLNYNIFYLQHIIFFSYTCSHRSTLDSSSFTVLLNNLRVLLIFDWLQLVHDFLQVPMERGSGGAQPHQCHSSSITCDLGTTSSTTGAVMPKTVKSGVVTKRSTVTVTQEHCLEVKINVTG